MTLGAFELLLHPEPLGRRQADMGVLDVLERVDGEVDVGLRIEGAGLDVDRDGERRVLDDAGNLGVELNLGAAVVGVEVSVSIR